MPIEVKLRKQPHEQQKIFIDCDAPEQLYGGAKRGGKSVALCQKISLLLTLFPGNRILLSRLNHTDLVDTTLNEFFQIFPPELIILHNKGERRVVVKTIDDRYTSELIYRGLGDPDDIEKIKSLNIGCLAIDEPSEVPFETYLMLKAQLTWQLPDGSRPPYMSLLASNPEPGWVEDRFITEPQEGCIFIPSLPRDNPHLPPGYEAELRRSYPADWVKKYLDGVWGASETAVFKALNEDIHNLDNYFKNENGEFDESAYMSWVWGLNLVTSFDHAATGVVAVTLNGVDRAGNLFAVQEHYESNQLISEHAIKIRAKLYDPYLRRAIPGVGQQSKQLLFELIDPSTTARTQQGGQQLQAIADDYRKEGFNVIPGWNALELGIERIKEHLHVLPTHYHPFFRQFGSPSLFISKSRCPMLWREMRGLKRKVTLAGQIVYEGSDHAVDTVRYFVNSQPRRPELEKLDDKYLSPLELLAKRSHDKWAKNWAKKDPTGRWFAGMGMGGGDNPFHSGGAGGGGR